MRHVIQYCWVAVMLIVGACASEGGTPLPPLTVSPPPTPNFTGDCASSRDLADWLQYSTFYVTDFARVMSEAAAKGKGDMYDDVILMGRMRADYGGIAAPDCAEAAHTVLVSAMSEAVSNFQAYINGEADSLGNTVAQVLGQLDEVSAIQTDLNTRLENQLQQQQTGS